LKHESVCSSSHRFNKRFFAYFFIYKKRVLTFFFISFQSFAVTQQQQKYPENA
jgi:hypothetical protein